MQKILTLLAGAALLGSWSVASAALQLSAQATAEANLSIESYVHINIHKDKLVMTTITGADIGTCKPSLAASLVDVLCNCPVTIRCPRSITLTNPKDGSLSVKAIIWLGLSYGHASYRFDENWEYVNLEMGDYTNGLRLLVSMIGHRWSYLDRAGAYAGIITLDIYSQ